MKVVKKPPFKQLEIELKLKELEECEQKWDMASKQYEEKGTVEDADEILKLAVEKVKILSEIIIYTDIV